MALPYTPQYSLLATVTNAGTFPVQVTSITNTDGTIVSLSPGTVVSVSGLTSATVSLSPSTVISVSGLTSATVSVTNLVSTLATVTNAGVFPISSLPSLAFGQTVTVTDGTLVSVSDGTIVSVSAGTIVSVTNLVSTLATVTNAGVFPISSLPSLAASTNYIGKVRITDGTNDATVTNTGLAITGDEAHDDADEGSPVKIGGKAKTSEPAAVANNDRVNAYFDANGYQFIREQPNTTSWTSLSALDDTYDNTTTANTSASFDVSNYRAANFLCTVVSSNSPTTIQWQLFVYDGSTEFTYSTGFWQALIREDTWCSSAQNISVPIPCDGYDIFRIKITCAGTDASNTFTVSNSQVMGKN